MGYIWKFDNVETQNKHEVSLGSCLFKMHLSFLKYWLGHLSGFFFFFFLIIFFFIIMSFYSDVELMQKLGN